MIKGFWNYTEPVTFTGITYEVTFDKEHPLYWQNAFAGQRRQALQVVAREGTETFIIDNENGQGYYKIMSGKGSPGFGHKSIFNPANILEISDEDIFKKYDHAGVLIEERLINEHAEKANPEEYRKLQSLKSSIKNKNFNAF